MLGPSIRGSHSLKRMCCRKATMIRLVSWYSRSPSHPGLIRWRRSSMWLWCRINMMWIVPRPAFSFTRGSPGIRSKKCLIGPYCLVFMTLDLCMSVSCIIQASPWRAYKRCSTYLLAMFDSALCCTGSDAEWSTKVTGLKVLNSSDTSLGSPLYQLPAGDVSCRMEREQHILPFSKCCPPRESRRNSSRYEIWWAWQLPAASTYSWSPGLIVNWIIAQIIKRTEVEPE